MNRLLKNACVAACCLAALLAARLDAAILTGVFYTAAQPPTGIPPVDFMQRISMWDSTLHADFPDNAEGSSELLWLSTNANLIADCRDMFDTAREVMSAKLHLYNVAGGDQATVRWAAYTVTSDWSEFEATWSNRHAVTPWQTAGGDIALTPEAGGVVMCTDEQYHDFDVTPLLSYYATNTESCAGLLFTTEDENGGEPFYSSADAAGYGPEQQPYFTLVFDDGQLTDAVVMAFSIILSNDYVTPVLTWTNAVAVDVLVCTNSAYGAPGNEWFVRVGNVTGTFADALAFESPAAYYRLVSRPYGRYTTTYDVGKFTVSIRQGSGVSSRENWISCPFDLVDAWGGTVQSKSFDEMMLEMCLTDDVQIYRQDYIQSQSPIGGSTWTARRTFGGWNYDDIAAITWDRSKMYRVTVSRYHDGADRQMTFVGRVPDRASTDVASIRKSNGMTTRENWVGYPYPCPASFDTAGIASVLTGEPATYNQDYVQSQFPLGYSSYTAKRLPDGWTVDGPSATNFYAGHGYRIFINKAHAGVATNWYCPSPY